MMKNSLLSGCAVIAGFSIAPSQVAFAGWSGQMNGTGYGRATASVTAGATGAVAAPTITTTAPSAAVNNPLGTNFKITSGLPGGASATTTSQITGSAGYVWKAVTTATGGDKTDNALVQSIMDIQPQASSKLTITTGITEDRLLTFDGEASGGTGLVLQVFNLNDQQTFSILAENPDNPPVPDLSKLEPDFFQPYAGEGVIDPISGRAQTFHFEFQLPPKDGENDPVDQNIWVLIDGFATSAAAPESGSLLSVLGLAVAGLAFARRRVAA